MFCRKCGKMLDGDLTICPECEQAAAQLVPVTAQTGAATVDKGSRKAGLGLGVVGASLALVGFFFTYFALFFLLIFAMELDSAYYDMNLIILEEEVYSICCGGLIVGVLGVVCVIPALVFGIISIVRAVKQKKRGQVMPIPTLILGIAACALAAFALLFFAISGFMAVIIIDAYTMLLV